MVSFSLSTLLAGSLVAAPVPPDGPAPDPKLLVGVWRYSPEDSGLPPWGTGVATLTADRRFHATFNMPGGGSGLFRDMNGSYRLDGRILHVVYAQGVGTPDERKAEAFLVVRKIDRGELRMAFLGKAGLPEIVLKREKKPE
jgi:hypothetical protein